MNSQSWPTITAEQRRARQVRIIIHLLGIVILRVGGFARDVHAMARRVGATQIGNATCALQRRSIKLDQVCSGRGLDLSSTSIHQNVNPSASVP